MSSPYSGDTIPYRVKKAIVGVLSSVIQSERTISELKFELGNTCMNEGISWREAFIEISSNDLEHITPDGLQAFLPTENDYGLFRFLDID